MKTLTWLALFVSLPLLAATPFTVDQVLSAPFPGDLVASPKGDAIAWVLNASGVRNIQVARAPSWAPAQVTKFVSDDGQEISGIAWKPDGSALLFTRGGDSNGRGEFPNPLSDPAGARQEIWMAPLGGYTAKLADGHSPTVSPDGTTVAWILNGQIWAMPFGGKPAQLVHARGSAGNLRWSPDATRLAFVSDRGDHAFAAVYNLRAKSLHFLDPSVDTDLSPVWSPDGKQIAFIRQPAAATDFEFGPKRSGPPWSIRIADAASGKGREVWRAQDGLGSVFWPMTAQDQLLWMANDRLVFPWERDGWLHLYAFDLHGGAARLLTPGEFEIEDAAPARDRGSVVFSSNQGDSDRRHLWRVSMDANPPRGLTSGSGSEWSSAPLNGDTLALLRSDAKLPGRAALLDSSGLLRDISPSSIPAGFPASALVDPQPVIVTANDGLSLHGQLFLPPDDMAGKHPALVFFHGGSRRQMLLAWHYMFYYNQTYGFNQYLASRGYVVLSLNYRGGIGYGEAFREAPGFGPAGASEFNDILGAAEYLRKRTDVDPARIGVWGGSYGGYLTGLALARASNLFAAGVDFHGVHDWNLEITKAAPARDADKRRQIERLAFESSPMASVATWKSPVLLVQGDDDRTVAFAQMVQLVEALRKQGVPFEQLVFPDEVHDFLLHADWLRAFHAADDFLARHLKP